MSESMSKAISGSSCRNRAISGTAAGFTWATRSLYGPSSRTASTALGNRSFSLVSSGCMRLFDEDLLGHHLLLELDQPVQERFRPRRAAGDVHVHRHDLIHPLHYAVGVVVVAGCRAGAHGDDVAGLRHLVVDAADDPRPLPADGPGDEHQVRLAGGGPGGPPPPTGDVVTGRHPPDQLAGATPHPQRQPPER